MTDKKSFFEQVGDAVSQTGRGFERIYDEEIQPRLDTAAPYIRDALAFPAEYRDHFWTLAEDEFIPRVDRLLGVSPETRAKIDQTPERQQRLANIAAHRQRNAPWTQEAIAARRTGASKEPVAPGTFAQAVTPVGIAPGVMAIPDEERRYIEMAREYERANGPGSLRAILRQFQAEQAAPENNYASGGYVWEYEPETSAQPTSGYVVEPDPVNRAADALKAGGAGLVKGVISTFGLPADALMFLGKLTAKGATALLPELADPEDVQQARIAKFESALPTSANLIRGAENVAGEFYEPQSTLGKYAGTVGEFVGGLAGPGLAAKGLKYGARGAEAVASRLRPTGMGGIPAPTVPPVPPTPPAGGSALDMLTRVPTAKETVKYAVIPGVASETAGQVTEGTKAEPYARAGAALIAGGGMAARDALKSGNRLNENLSRLTQQQLDEAQQLMAQSKALGAPLTLAEAANQVTGNAANHLLNMQRFVESTQRGSQIMDPFMAQRPVGNVGLFEKTVGGLGETIPSPTEIAPRVQQAAEGAIGKARSEINKESRPFYQDSRAEIIDVGDPQALDRLNESSYFQKFMRDVRRDPAYKDQLADLPDNSVGVLDAVKKRIDTEIERLSNPNNPRMDRNAISRLNQLRKDVRGAAKQASQAYAGPDGVGAYGKALEIQAKGRKEILEPMERAPIGQLAGTNDAWGGALERQKNIIFSAPVGGQQQVSEAMRAVYQADPQAARSIIKQHMDDTFSKKAELFDTGNDQWGAAKWVNKLAKQDPRGRNLFAALEAVNPEATPAFKAMMKIFEAQGKRRMPGSQTQANQMLQQEMSKGTSDISGILTSGGAVLTSPGKLASFSRDFVDGLRFGRNTEYLARVLTDPDLSAKVIAAAKMNPASNAAGRALVRVMQQGYLGNQQAQSTPVPRQ